MDNAPYSNREIDALAERLGEKIDSGIEHVSDRVAGFEKDTRESLTRIETQVGYTNGKVKKIILALVLLSGITLGLGFNQLGPVLGLLISL